MAFGPAPARSTASNRKPSSGPSINSARQRSPISKTACNISSVPQDEVIPGPTAEDIQFQIDAEQVQANKCQARCLSLQKAIADAEAEAVQYRDAIVQAETSAAGGGSSQDVQRILRCVLEVMQPVRQKLMAKAEAGTLTDQESIAYVALTGWNQKSGSSQQEEQQTSVTPAHRRQVRSLSPPTLASLPTSQCPTPNPHGKLHSQGFRRPQAAFNDTLESFASGNILQEDSMPMTHDDCEMLEPPVCMSVEPSSGIGEVSIPKSVGFIPPAANDPLGIARSAGPAPPASTPHRVVDVVPDAALDDMPELKIKQPCLVAKQSSQQVPTPMSQLKKLKPDLEVRRGASQPQQANKGEQKESLQIADEQPEMAATSSSPRMPLKERAQLMRQKLLERKQRRMPEELQDPPLIATSKAEVLEEDQTEASKAQEEIAADSKQQRRESLKLVRQQWQEKQKRKQQEKMSVQQDAEQQQVAKDVVQVHESQEPQSFMAKIMLDYTGCKELKEEIDTLPPVLDERQDSKHMQHILLSNKTGSLGQQVGQWAESKQKLLQREDEVRKRWEGLEELLPPDLQQNSQAEASDRFSLSTSSNALEKLRLPINPCPATLRSIVGTYMSKDCESIMVQATGAVFFDLEDLGVVIAHDRDGTPLLRPRGMEAAPVNEGDYAFRLVSHNDGEVVWLDEVDTSAPYVRWKRASA